MQTLNKDIVSCLENLLQSITNLDVSEIESEKKIINSEIKQLISTEEWSDSQNIEDFLWKRPYSIPCCGIEENFKWFNIEDVESFKLLKHRCRIVVSGFIDAKILRDIEFILDNYGISSIVSSRISKKISTNLLKNPNISKKSGFHKLKYVFHVPGLGSMDDVIFSSIKFFSDYLANRRNGLGYLLREKNSLVYFCESNYLPYFDAGAIYITFASEIENLSLIENLIRDYFQRNFQITKENLENYLFGFDLENEKLVDRVSNVSLYELYELDLKNITPSLSKLNILENAVNYLKDYLHPENGYII